ncbi:type II secretion system protein F [Achromatium sp. WMS2]|nr:type II secretion system protein F [Achromatium sp. WMS2]
MAPKAPTTKTVKPPKIYTYAWEGVDKGGKTLKGEVKASSVLEARKEAQRSGVRVKKISKKAEPLFQSKPKITPKDIAIFSRQLATMMSSGVPIVQAFDIVGKGHANASMQDLILGIKAEVEGGNSLANSLRKKPQYFDDLFCNLVEAGENGGVLDSLLDKIATYKEKTEEIKAKVKKAMTYPIAVMVVAVVVTMVLLIFVIPKFKELFDGFGAKLPEFTLMVIGMSEYMQANWWIVLGTGFAIGYTFKTVHQRSERFRELVDIGVLKIPVVGEILEKSAIARFGRTLSTIFAAGVPLTEALQSVAGATGNFVFSSAVMRMRTMVSEGQSLQLAMKQQEVFPNMVVQMTAIGEEAGSLDKMLSKVADFYEAEVDNAVDALSSLMEPLIMVVIGGMVGGLIVAMYLPIFQMANAV